MEQWYSDAYFHKRLIHVIRKDVRFTLTDRRRNNRNYSLSNSHVRIAFVNFLATLTAITILALIVSCSDVNSARERNSVFKKMCFNNMWSRIDIPHNGVCVSIAKKAFSNRKKRCLINWLWTRIGNFRGVYVFNSMSFFKQLSE